MRLRNKLLIIFLIFLLILSAGVVYLNNFFLPTKIKSLVVDGLTKATGKTVALESVRFNILKGLVIRNLVISDDKNTIFTLKEGSCTFLFLPVFKKMLILPTVTLRSAVIFLNRRKDNTFNIQDLFPKSAGPKVKSGFSIFVYKVSLRDAVVKFRDDTFTESFAKDIKNIDANIYLFLPTSVKLNLSFEIPASPLIKFESLGEYRMIQKELGAKVVIKDFSPREFMPYYQNSGLIFARGSIDSQVNLRFKGDSLGAGFFLKSKGFSVAKKQVTYNINSNITGNINYNLKDKKIDFSANAAVVDSSVRGVNFVGSINAINGEIALNKGVMSSNKLTANIWGLPIETKGNFSYLGDPLFEVTGTTSLGLPMIKRLLQDKLKFTVPGQLSGQANLTVVMQNKAPKPGEFSLVTYLDVIDSKANIDKIPSVFSAVNGRLIYDGKRLMWPKLRFGFMGKDYSTQGSVSDFKNPLVQFELASDELKLDTSFIVAKKTVNLSRFSGRYLNTVFNVSGNINTLHDPAMEANLSGSLDLDLSDIGKAFIKTRALMDKMRPSGVVRVGFDFTGNIKNVNSYAINTDISAKVVSFYGLKAQELIAKCSQANGIIDVPGLQLSLYGGKMGLSGRIDAGTDDPGYMFTADIQGIKLQELKMDTPLKEEDIEGEFSSQFKLNGLFKDLSALKGDGKASITQGKLWELDLFKGIGSLLLVKDFAKIVFREGNCEFVVQDKYISTDKLELKSSIMEIFGPVKIGFVDNTIDATLEVNVIDEMVPLSGTFKDVTTAIVGQAGKFGTIRITGDLKKPDFKFKAAVTSILKSLKDTIFGKPAQ